MMLDHETCAPESEDTLKYQQSQLLRGTRYVQMFPNGSSELELPTGFKRHQTKRGVFHYDPVKVSSDLIDHFSMSGRENALLNLGPYNKTDIANRAIKGEKVTCIAEYTPDGVEVRTAVATTGTVSEQQAYFERTKEPGNQVVIGILPNRVLTRLTESGM